MEYIVILPSVVDLLKIIINLIYAGFIDILKREDTLVKLPVISQLLINLILFCGVMEFGCDFGNEFG